MSTNIEIYLIWASFQNQPYNTVHRKNSVQDLDTKVVQMFKF